MEIEAKWTLEAEALDDLLAFYADGSSHHGYVVDVRWGGIARRFVDVYYDTPDDPKAQTIISQVLLDEYSLQELRLALAALDGVHELPLSEKPLGYENVKPWRPPVEQPPLPPQRIFTPTDETPALPSAKATQEISGILTSMPASDFQWLLAHAGDPQDFRSRLLMVKYRLFKFNWEDVTATLAALQRTIPPSEPEEPL